MSASLLVEERPAITSGYAWLVSESNQDRSSHSTPGCDKAECLDRFDELVAEQVVARLRQRDAAWSMRSTGDVVLTVLEQLGWFTGSECLIPVRNLVCRAHTIAQQIVSAGSWMMA